MATATTYANVIYVTKGSGTLKLFDDQLTFTTRSSNKIYTLPWKKVQRRHVTNSQKSREGVKPKIKLVLFSGTEAIFQMDDRVALEVLRDDIAERLAKYKALHPPVEEEAVNSTKLSAGRRESTPYSMAKPDPPIDLRKKEPDGATWSRESAPYTMKTATSSKPKVRDACELISLHGLYLEEQGTRSAVGSVFRRGNGSLSEPLANGLMDRS